MENGLGTLSKSQSAQCLHGRTESYRSEKMLAHTSAKLVQERMDGQHSDQAYQMDGLTFATTVAFE